VHRARQTQAAQFGKLSAGIVLKCDVGLTLGPEPEAEQSFEAVRPCGSGFGLNCQTHTAVAPVR
jgi:hypothetical protein